MGKFYEQMNVVYLESQVWWLTPAVLALGRLRSPVLVKIPS